MLAFQLKSSYRSHVVHIRMCLGVHCYGHHARALDELIKTYHIEVDEFLSLAIIHIGSADA